MKRLISLLLISLIISMSFIVVGCANNNDEPSPNQTQAVTEQDLNRVKFAATIAEEKIITIFEDYTPEGSETTYLVGKSRYSTVEEVKAFLSSFYTEEMTNNIVDNYIKVEDVLGIGKITTLNLPKDYLSILGHEFSTDDSVKIDNDKATISFTQEDKKVTYTLVKFESNWLVDSKTIE